jgi:hypothetical protein
MMYFPNVLPLVGMIETIPNILAVFCIYVSTFYFSLQGGCYLGGPEVH